jgi:hypothetical protein
MSNPTTNQADSTASQTPRGVYISRGMTLGIRNFRLVLGEDGSVDSDLVIEVSLDTHPFWLEIAWTHLERARSAHQKLLAVWGGDDEKRKGSALEAEFGASMQCIVAAAVAMDAFYSAIRPHITIPKSTLDAWRKKRTARPAQVYEVLRRGFRFGPQTGKLIKRGLKEVFEWRDRSVHPSAEAARPIAYPELGVGTESRFVAYRHYNAQRAMGFALSLIRQLLDNPRPNHSGLVRYCEGALPRVRPIVRRWERRYGQLYQRKKSSRKRR